jgi:2-amino-4-hydroxy-6-hydroxymethyldihydropteridine diphosphokinase
LNEPGLELPHPRMMDRAFVLVPLMEIEPGLTISGVRLDERLREIDREGIERIEGSDWWKS